MPKPLFNKLYKNAKKVMLTNNLRKNGNESIML